MAKTFAMIFGAVFVLVGLMGFLDTPLVGMDGLFQTDTLHDLVHLLLGAILLVVAFTAPQNASKWLIISGFIYLVLVILGFLLIPGGGELLGLVTMNHADHWLHVVLSAALLLTGYMTRGDNRGSIA